MSPAELNALIPLMVLGLASVTVMLVIAFYRCHQLTALLTWGGLLAALATLPVAASGRAQSVTTLLMVDGFGLFYMGLILVTTLAVGVLSFTYLEKQSGLREEFYVLLLLAALGASALVTSSHFASFFLGLELLSISLYALIAYLRENSPALEAGAKYLILAAASSAFLLFGMALIYARIGTMQFARMNELLLRPHLVDSPLLLTGLAMLVAGVGFKLAVVPFHLWTPDVYQGAPAPVAAFVATVSKGGVFAVLLRYFTEITLPATNPLFGVFAAIAVASMIVGNLLALLQNNVKRILAYSSIAHLGYLLVAFLASGQYALIAVTFYLVAYFITTLGAFGVIAVISPAEGEVEALQDYRGLFWRRPWLAGTLTANLLSLAGIPLTAGFIGKFYLLAAGVESQLWMLVILLVLSSVIGLYYYLRVVVTMLREPISETEARRIPMPLTRTGHAYLGVMTLLLVWLGIYPSSLLEVIEATVGTLGR